MKIIIIGANGMLGQELAQVYAESKPLLWDIKELDITNREQVMNKISKQKADIVFNAAAFNDVDGAEEKEDIAMSVNGIGPGNLAEAVQSYGGILVQYSTDYVFKGDKKEGYIEVDQPDPQSVYAKSKHMGEIQVAKHCDKYYIIRLSKLFGRPAIAENSKKSFVDMMIGLAKDKDELNVVDEELSAPAYAPDLANRSKEIVDTKQPYGIYHACNSGVCTWYDLVKETFTIKDIDVKVNSVPGSFYPRPAARPMYSILLNTKMPEIRSWQEALKEYLTN
ncbi:MAG: dTDP-4-dehydrorhamnose reductase [Candidatus Kerfeldbacteria bacterium]|jgi:dTDP-4-dehydrorhamnose reductase